MKCRKQGDPFGRIAIGIFKITEFPISGFKIGIKTKEEKGRDVGVVFFIFKLRQYGKSFFIPVLAQGGARASV